jgi:hypothetical protein
MLLRYIQEFEAFSCLINLLHSFHFLSFFQGDMKEVEWRVRFFNKLLQNRLPLVFNHLKCKKKIIKKKKN